VPCSTVPTPPRPGRPRAAISPRCWWNDKHNRHHANPNHTDKDPDVAAGVLVWTLDQAEGRKGLHGWLSRYQARILAALELA
jgi:fatty-acid desaturase